MPAYIPPDFLDNTGERTLADALVRLIAEWDQAELDAATGFFEPHVWRYLGEAFPHLTRLRLLLGRPPAVAPQGEVQAIDLRRYFRRKLQGDLEALPYNTDYVALVDALLAFLRRDPALKQLLADFERAEDRAALELETVIAEVLGGSGESERP
jgi:hypothetical protein